MRLRYLISVFVVLAASVLTASGDDYWVKIDWKQWSKEECNKMLEDSPWTRPWEQTISNAGARLPSASGAAAAGAAGDSTSWIRYYLQIRSAMPVRQAIVRQSQIENKYETLPADQKKAFDDQTKAYLDHDFPNTIVFHVVYDASTPTFARQLSEYWQSVPSEPVPIDMVLVNEHGDRIKPIRFISPRSGAYEFDMVFPRMVNNEPVVREGDKTLHIQFNEPAINVFPAELANIDFKVDKMLWNGKLSY